ncbi:hypothetical protein BV898_16996 [Hypsibius exemplaris]|uniref:Uncharacterized protein n=1 Tax=Hypsibius exemplaris TaxID=2072580 RepID=A0A9X6NFW2_HYPEX|nr:hypothetical protein BV898_16996 [Hypsibius exemplaris]
MSFNESILSGSLNASDRNNSICTVSIEQFNAQNLIPLLVASATVAAQLFHILIFRLWSNKEPYLILHISLAYGSAVQPQFDVSTHGSISIGSAGIHYPRWRTGRMQS